jgi:hypothetical protein
MYRLARRPITVEGAGRRAWGWVRGAEEEEDEGAEAAVCEVANVSTQSMRQTGRFSGDKPAVDATTTTG